MNKVNDDLLREYIIKLNNDNVDWSKIREPIEFEPCGTYIDEEYIFGNQIKQLEEIMSGYLSEKGKRTNRNIGIVGERGTGKTSVLMTFKNILENRGIGKSYYYVFDIVDPGLLTTSLNILEILISGIFKEINKSDYEEKYIEEFKHGLLIKLKKISETLSNIRKEEDFYKENNPQIDVLDDIRNRANFKKDIEKILKEFKEFLNLGNKDYKILDLVLIIDDLDMVENHITYKILEDIQNYLNGSMTIIIAYRDEQLMNSLMDVKLKENELLLNKSIIDNVEVSNQCLSILNKLIPYNNRIYLTESNEMYMDKVLYYLLDEGPLSKLGGITVEEFLSELIFYCTNIIIQPVEANENTDYLLPRNLRGTFQLLELLIKKMDHDINDDVRTSLAYNRFLNNLPIYRKYFETEMENVLEFRNKKFLRDWKNKEIHLKNYFTYSYLRNQIIVSLSDKEDDYKEKIKNQLLNINYVQPYNIAIGDIYKIIYYYKAVVCKTKEDYHFIYCLKMFYSFELLQSLLKHLYSNEGSLDDIKNNENASNYLELINVKVIPDNFEYISGDSKHTMTLQINEEDIKNNDLIWKIHYTDIAEYGTINKEVRLDGKSDINSINNKNYRQYYNYGEIGSTGYQKNILKNTKYHTDPFSFLGKKKYLEDFGENISKKKSNINKKENYVFYSFFDIDIFLRITYTSPGEKYIYSKILTKINDIFTNETKIPIEREVLKTLGKRSFINGELCLDEHKNSLYIKPFTDENKKSNNIEDAKKIMRNRKGKDDFINLLDIDEIKEEYSKYKIYGGNIQFDFVELDDFEFFKDKNIQNRLIDDMNRRYKEIASKNNLDIDSYTISDLAGIIGSKDAEKIKKNIDREKGGKGAWLPFLYQLLEFDYNGKEDIEYIQQFAAILLEYGDLNGVDTYKFKLQLINLCLIARLKFGKGFD